MGELSGRKSPPSDSAGGPVNKEKNLTPEQQRDVNSRSGEGTSGERTVGQRLKDSVDTPGSNSSTDLFHQRQQFNTTDNTQGLTLRTNDGNVQTGRIHNNPKTGESFVQLQGDNNNNRQLYKLDQKTHSLQPVDHNGKPTGGAALEYTNIRSGHPPAGTDPHKFIGHQKQATKEEFYGRRPEGDNRRSEGEGRKGQRQEGDGRQLEGGKQPQADRRTGIDSQTRVPHERGPSGFNPTFHPGKDKGPESGDHSSKSRREGRNPGEKGSEGGLAKEGGDRFQRGQTKSDESGGPGFQRNHGDRSWNRSPDGKEPGPGRADIQDRISRRPGDRSGSYNGVDGQGTPLGMPLKDVRRFEPPGEGRQGGRRNWESGEEHGGKGRGPREGRGSEESSGRRPGEPGGRGLGEPGGKGSGLGQGGLGHGGGRGDGSPDDMGSRRGRRWDNPSGEGVGGGPRPPRNFEGEIKGPLGSGMRGDFLPPGGKHNHEHSLENRLTRDLQNPQARKALLDAIEKFQTGKLDLAGKDDSRMAEILKGIKPDQLGDLKAMLLPEGKSGPRFDISKLHTDTQKSLGDMMTLLGRPGKISDASEAGKNPAVRLLDLLGKTERPMDKIPTGEQSRALMLELIKGMNENNRGTRQSETFINSLTRSFGEKPGERGDRGMLPQERKLTLNNEFTGATLRELTLRLQTKDLLVAQQPETIRIAETRTQENLASSLINRVQPENLQGVRADEIGRVLGSRDLVSKIIENAATTRAQQADIVPGVNPLAPTKTNLSETPIDSTAANTATSKVDTKYQENLEELQNRKKREEKENEKKEKEEVDRAEFIAMMQARKLKEQKERELKDKEKAQEKDKKQVQKLNQRIRYRIRQGDTIEGIAERNLNDVSLARLIFNLNKTVIPILKHNGKRYADPKEGTMIWLPNQTDIEMFRNSRSKDGSDIEFGGPQYTSADEELAARFGNNWNNDNENSSSDTDNKVRSLAELEKVKARRANIEKYLGPLHSKSEEPLSHIRHICRLGDTLRGIALRHPALKDVELWKLIALINNLSIETDTKGNPLIEIKRGTTILIPNQTEIDKFRAERLPSPAIEAETEAGKEIDLVEATLAASALSMAKEEPITSGVEQAPAELEEDLEVLPVLPIEVPDIKLVDNESNTVIAESSSPGIENLNEEARIVTSGNSHDFEKGFTLTLEICLNGNWQKALTYDFYDDIGLRHEYTLEGKTHTVRVNLPAAQAIQLAHNELTVRWDQHKNRLTRQAKSN